MANLRIVSNIVKNKAINEIKDFINFSRAKLIVEGWTYKETNRAPESFKKLLQSTIDKCILIADYGSDNSIYQSKHYNTLFRFYHDVTHIKLNKSFSEKCEYAVIDQHIEELKAFGASELAIEIFKFDTYGQVDYYFKHKQFVSNQNAFLDSCLSRGLKTALTFKH